jgi:uncharacterized integral membrane protein
MPILLIALLALLVFGLIGVLLTVAMVMEHRKRASSAKISDSSVTDLSVPSGANP